MTIVVDAEDEKILEQIKKQLNRLIDVLTVTDFTKKEHVERELILATVAYSAKTKAALEGLLDKYKAIIVKRKKNSVIIEFMGEQGVIKELLRELSRFGIKELIRTGRIAMAV